MIVRTLQAVYTDRWHPAGAEIEIPDDHFDPAVHAALEPAAEVEPAPEPAPAPEEIAE